MHYCDACKTIEGEFYELETDDEDEIVYVCKECGERDTKITCNEHDDSDMER